MPEASAQDIFHICNIRQNLVLQKQPAAAALQNDRGDTALTGVAVKAFFASERTIYFALVKPAMRQDAAQISGFAAPW